MSSRFLYVIIFLVLAQSCAVYQKVPISLQESVNKGEAKVFEADKEYQIFQNIALKDGIYFGLTKSGGAIVLDPNLVEEVYLKNYRGSINDKPMARFIAFTALAAALIGAFIILYLTAG